VPKRGFISVRPHRGGAWERKLGGSPSQAAECWPQRPLGCKRVGLVSVPQISSCAAETEGGFSPWRSHRDLAVPGGIFFGF
jgi:hypothetical protein